MWCLKTNTVSVLVGVLGIIKKSKGKHINKITGCPIAQSVGAVEYTDCISAEG